MRLIDADALIEDVDGDLTDSIAEGRAIEKIMNAPTIEERKTGEWIKRALGWKCSNCNLCTNDRGADDFNFCPNCGADMRGEE